MQSKYFDDEIHSLRIELGRIGLSALRLKRDLVVHKYRSDQPRAPAGTSEGGQWVDEGGLAHQTLETVRIEICYVYQSTGQKRSVIGNLNGISFIAK